MKKKMKKKKKPQTRSSPLVYLNPKREDELDDVEIKKV